MRILYHPKKQSGVSLGFEAYCAPAGFDRTAQAVDIYEIFKAYYATNTDAKTIYSFTSAINTLALDAASGVSYRWGETIAGVDYVHDVSSGTAFTAGSTKRYVIVNNTTTSASSFTYPKGAVWIYAGLLVDGMASRFNSYLTYIHCNSIDDITRLHDYSFQETNLTGILTINHNLGSYAFSKTKITSINFGSSITQFSYANFFGCTQLTGTLTLPVNLTSWDVNNFYGCTGLTGNLTFPSGLSSIPGSSFYGCTGLTSLTLPNNITSIGNSAFYGCTGLTGTLTLPNNITTLGTYTFYGCTGFTGTLTIPSTLSSCGAGSFVNTNFNAILNSSSNFEISDYVLYDISTSGKVKALHAVKGQSGSLTLKSDATEILYGCFYSNTARTGVLSLPSNVTAIGDYAFYNCTGLTGAISISNSITTLGAYAFYNCIGFNSTITLGNGFPTLGAYTFYNCTGLTGNLTIPNNVKSIGTSCFYNCNKLSTTLTISTAVTSIGNSAFYGCKGFTGTLTIPNSCLTLDGRAFQGCTGFTALDLGTGVTTLVNNYVFMGCTGFTGTLSLPASLTNISYRSFYGCTGFTRCDAHRNTAPTTGAECFASFPAIPLHVLAGTSSYTTAPWTTTSIFSSITKDL
jgi:hypothetical protein